MHASFNQYNCKWLPKWLGGSRQQAQQGHALACKLRGSRSSPPQGCVGRILYTPNIITPRHWKRMNAYDD